MSLNKKRYKKVFLVVGLSATITVISWMVNPINSIAFPLAEGLGFLAVDTPEIELPFPFEDGVGGPNGEKKSPVYLKTPSNIKSGFEYDPETGTYNYYERIGDRNYKYPTYMDFEEYINYDSKKSINDYWKLKASSGDIGKPKGFRPKLIIKGKAFDRLFGGNVIDIRPQGSAEISFGVNISKRDNPALPVNQRRSTTFDFDQKIQLNVVGNIGEKLKLSTSYNTEATFDFENKMKINYKGLEDEIIQKIEAGNVSLPLKSSLITGSQTLFGLKTEMRFGRLSVTSVFSQEKGEKKEIEIQGGAQVKTFQKEASEYEANRHYFLSQYFRDEYERSLSALPIINSRVNITKIEVWVSNVNNSITNTKNIIGFMDLGEATNANIYNPAVTDANAANNPDNESNSLYPFLTSGGVTSNAIRSFVSSSQALEGQGYVNGTDFEKYENARLLSSSEYTLSPQLGYISLNSSLNSDEVLAVSFQYTIDGEVYQVGEFSTDGVTGQDALLVKLLKGSTINTKIPIWDLMMKNVYSLGAFNVSSNDFFLDIWYLNPATGVEIPFIPEGEINQLPLINVLNLDQLNTSNQTNPDGVFDFINGVTINASNGKVYFPVLEPFGSHLSSKFSNQQTASKFTYDSLYSTTQALAKQDASKNRFKIKGQYSSSSSSDISLNAMNVPEGSVVVTAGGASLTENVDYTVDYNLGRVKIINEGILQSGTPIKISLESQSLFNIQSKTLLGSRFDYKISDDFNIGSTILRLSEKPLTSKISIGNEPIANTIWGLDVTYSTDAPFLTRWVDKLPIYSTKEKSYLTMEGEFAHLIPGNPRAISSEGTAYVDDFEGSQSTIDLKTHSQWKLASTPQGQTDLFPEGALSNNLAYGYNRAKLAWYIIDPLFWRNNSQTPDHIKNDDAMQSNHYMREVLEKEVFPFKDQNNGIVTNIPVLDLAYYPLERGPYNYDEGLTPYGAGIDGSGNLLNPASRWGGIMRKIETTDFESSNIEFIQFWVMDPFDSEDGDPGHSGGQLYFNIGNISEDVLKDSRKSFENGLPTTSVVDPSMVDTTAWGRVPTIQALVNAFDNNPDTRPFQDVGLDGLSDVDEIAKFGGAFGADPSADNYHFYRGSDYDNTSSDILERYKEFNGLEGNSPTSEQETTDYTTSSTTRPDIEDLNLNNNLDFRESYYQYAVNLNPSEVDPANVGQNFITNVLDAEMTTKTGSRTVRWYQFKIPIREPQKIVGDIQDFKSIRFMRMFLKGFDKEVVLRFAKLELIRGEWRKYNGKLLSVGDYLGDDNDNTSFIISAVNIEENSEKTPVNYILPPDIERQINPNPSSTANTLVRLNEQSLSLNVCNLDDGYAKAAYKVMDVDFRRYKRLKMYVHAEETNPAFPLNNGDLSVFIRVGTDFDENYYEYELPLEVTPEGFYNTSSDENSSDRLMVWPEKNNIDLDFSEFTDMKIQRNGLLADALSSVSIIKPYEVKGINKVIRIKGNPNLANVKVFMIGIRNSKQNPLTLDDDGLAKCAEVWVNELRLTEFDNSGGWASQARITAQLADLGSITLAGNYSTPGFGSIEKKLNERQQETRRQYDVSTSVELGKFVPEKIGISLPLYYGISEGKVTPKYNPLDPDLELKKLLKNDVLTKEDRDSIGTRTEEYTKRKSINFTNVRKLKPKGKTKSHFYDITNVAFNYAYSETFYRDINTEFDIKKTYRGGLAYAFSNSPKNYKPFGKIKLFNKKAFKSIKDFNFYLLPKQLSFQTDLDRAYAERRTRNNTGYTFDLPAYYQKHFYWNRAYSLKYDLTKQLRFDFSATNNATINEPIENTDGRVDKDHEVEYESWKDTVRQSIREFGINTHYHHNFNLSYSVPINKLPFLNFITLKPRYSGDYDWQRAPIGRDSLGNTIQNSNTISANSQLNMTKFYNSIKYFKEVQKRMRARARKRTQPKKKRDPKKSAVDNAKVEGWKAGKPPPKMKVDLKKFKDKNKKFVELWKKREPPYLLDLMAELLMSVKNVSATYKQNRGTFLPGYGQETEILGSNSNFSAPGFNFISGIQEDNFAIDAADRDWLVGDKSSLMYNYNTTFSENYTFRATINPITTLRIQVNATRNYSENLTQQFFWDDTLGQYKFPTPVTTGNYSMSYISFNTAFMKDNKDDYSSQVFQDFLDARQAISERLAKDNQQSVGNDSTGLFNDGYNGTSQDVLIPAFIAGYSGQDGKDVSLGSFRKYIPNPNWRITYDGLSKLPLLKSIFKKFTITHSYRSTFNVSSFTTNIDQKDEFQNIKRDIDNNFISEFQISTVSISEQFSPLVGVNMTLKNNMSFRVDYKQDRNASLSVTNGQITETKGSEISIGTGYKFAKVKLPFMKKRVISSPLDTRIDFSIRSNNTVIRKIVEEVTQLTGGQRVISIKFTADYKISQKLNIRAFYDYISTKPFISTTFPTANTNAGISLRFTLSQ